MEEVVTEADGLPAEELKILDEGGANMADGLVRMHEFIWILQMGKNIPNGMKVGHVDGDPFNNTKANLFLCAKASMN